MRNKIALVGGRIHTPLGLAEALLIEGGRITEAGSSVSRRAEGAEIIDLKGRTVLPGFSDSHMHLMNWMESQELLALKPCRTIDDVKAVLGSRIAENPLLEGEWYRGQGWDQAFMGRMPNRNDLDGLSPFNPVLLTRFCGHVAVVNSAAIEALGLTSDTSIDGGVIELGEDGEPSGILSGAAVRYVYESIPYLENQDMSRLLEKYGPQAASFGLTELNSDDMGMFGYDFRRSIDFYKSAKKEGNLPFRVRQQFSLPSRELLLDFLSEGWQTGDGTPFFQIGPLKLVCGYADTPVELGAAVHEQDELNELIFIAHSAGMQVAVHAIGDEALEMCLDAFETAQLASPGIVRHQIVQTQIADDGQLNRMKKLGIGAVIQPNFAPYHDTAGPKYRWKAWNPWKTMLRKGITLSAGSGAPNEDLRPLYGLHAAVTRQNLDHEPNGGWLPEEKLTVAEALSLYTWSGAWFGGNEKRRGEIVAGRDADLVVLNEDPFLTKPSELWKIGIAMTICGGCVTYRSDDIGH